MPAHALAGENFLFISLIIPLGTQEQQVFFEEGGGFQSQNQDGHGRIHHDYKYSGYAHIRDIYISCPYRMFLLFSFSHHF